MQRGPRRTHTGQGETQGLQAGSEGTGCSGRAAGPPSPPQSSQAPPRPTLPIYRVPPRPCCALAPGERGEGEGAGERGNATGPYPGHHPSAAGSEPGWRRLRGRAGGTGKAFHHRPPPPAPGWAGDVQPHCRWLPSKPQPQDPGRRRRRRRVSGLCQTPTHGICTPPASWSRQPLPTPPS